jgi:N-dimethylarginine dimethylaminohydrolase
MYSVYQHWDPLKVCIVGRSYNPEFYHFIKNHRVRSVMERIATETEEDYQKVIKLLERFGVQVLRPEVRDDWQFYFTKGRIQQPPMTPRDYTIMLGNDFYFKATSIDEQLKYMWRADKEFKGVNWPADPPATIQQIENLPQFVKDELTHWFGVNLNAGYQDKPNKLSLEQLTPVDQFTWGKVLQQLQSSNPVFHQVPNCLNQFNSAMTTRVGKDIYLGTDYYNQDTRHHIENIQKLYPQYRWHKVDTGGHNDGTFCPVAPGLIVSLRDIPTYSETFPGWEVIYLPGQSWSAISSFAKLKNKNQGKWWVPGEELNDEFTDFVESWLNHWVGYVEETVFDVNMLIIDQQNVICNNYNESVFRAFEQRGITPHVINFRHRYFWDGGLHCITSDLARKGDMQDYFPQRSTG